jgi:hypothetical protein
MLESPQNVERHSGGLIGIELAEMLVFPQYPVFRSISPGFQNSFTF